MTLSGTVNANPTVTGVNLGQTLTVTGSFNDPGRSDVVSVEIDWGDGVVVSSTDANSGIVINAAARTFTASRAAAAVRPEALVDGAALITVTARDNEGGSRSSVISYRLANAMPVITAMAAVPTTIVEGSEVVLSLDIADTDATGAPSVTIAWGDGTTTSDGTITGNAASGFRYTARHVYADDPAGTATDRFSITATVKDTAYTVTRSTDVTVRNSAPTLEDIQLAATAQAGDRVTLTGRIADLGAQDIHTLSIDWGDGTSTLKTITPGQRQFSIDKVYDKASAAAGLSAFTVTITAVDADDAGSKAVATRSLAVGAPAREAAPRFVTLTVPTTVVEGNALAVSGEITDAGSDPTLTVSINWGNAYLSEVTARRDTPDGPYRFTATAPSDAFPNGAPVGGVDTAAQVVIGVRNSLGIGTTATRTVTVTNAAPAVGPLAATPEIVPYDGPTRGQVTLSGTVTDPGLVDALTVEIDWNDGSATQTVAVDSLTRRFTASHTYAVTDPLVLGRETYQVKVTAIDESAARSQAATLDVRLKDLSPVIDRLTVTAGREGATQAGGGLATIAVAATNISSTDQSLLRYNIDIGNDNSWDLANWQTASSFTIDQASFYATSGAKSVRIGVQDGNGRIRSVIVPVTVADVPPTLATGAAASIIDEGGTYRIRLTADDPSTADVITAWTVDWGDGTTSTYTAANMTGYGNGWNIEVSHVYADDNRALDADGKRTGPAIAYQVKVKASGTDAGTLDAPGQSVVVSNVAPAFITATTQGTIVEGGTVRLTGSFKDVGAKDGQVLSVDWGDGSAPTTATFTGTDKSFSLTHVMVQDSATLTGGAHAIKLTLVDTDGAAGEPFTISQIVTNAAPVFGTLTVDTSTLSEGGKVVIRGSFTDAGSSDTHSVLLTFGDGTSATIANDQIQTNAGTRTFTYEKVYADNGQVQFGQNGTTYAPFTIKAVVSDETGAKAEKTVDVTVSNVDPLIADLKINGIDAKPGGGLTGQPNGTVVLSKSGGTVTVTGRFFDPGKDDALSLVIDWNDGTASRMADMIIGAPRADGPLAGWRDFTAVHTYGGIDQSRVDPFVFNAMVILEDKDGGSAGYQFDVELPDPTPKIRSIDLTPSAANEGDLVTATVTYSDDDVTNPATVFIRWGLVGGQSLADTMTVTYDAASGLFTAKASRVFGDNTGPLQPLILINDSDNLQANARTRLTVANVAPSDLTLSLPAVMDEGSVATLSGSFFDPGLADGHTVKISWSDGVTAEVGATRDAATGRYQFSASRDVVDQLQGLKASVLVSDKDGGTVSGSVTTNVQNVAPAITNLSVPGSLSPTGTLTVSGTVRDKGVRDAVTLTIDWEDGSLPEIVTVDSLTGTFSASKTYAVTDEAVLGRNAYTVTIRAADGDGGVTSLSRIVSLKNVDPVVEAVSVTPVVDENGVVVLTGRLSDGNAGDRHRVTITWGDGVTETVAVDPTTRTFDATHRYVDDATGAGVTSGRYTVTVTATDGQGGSGSKALPDAVTVRNVAPTIADVAVTPTIDENGTVTLTGRVVDAGTNDTHRVTITWGDGVTETVAVDPQTRTFTTTHRYADDAASAGLASGRYSVGVTVTDGQGGTTTTTLPDAVTVRNVAPTLADVTVTPTIDENGTVTLTGRVIDAGTNDTHRVTITWGDGVTETVAVDPQTRTFTATHRYADDAASAGVASGRYSVGVTVTDGQGGTTTTTLPDAVTVRNVAPTIADVTVTPTIDENGTVTLTGRVVDAGTNDTHRVTITWGDGVTETVAVDPQTRTFTTTHRYADDAASAGLASGRYSVGVTVTDGQGGTTTTTLPDAVTVRNVAPTLADVTVTPTIDENGTVTLTGRVIDAGTNDTHRVTITWGDGVTETVAVDPQTRTFTATHRYADDAASAGVASGRYSVGVTVTDGQGGTTTTTLPDAVTVRNVAPTLADVAVTPTIDENGTVTLTGRVVDAGTNDTHRATITWGDGVTETVAVDPQTRTFTTTHRYADDAASAGVASGRYSVGVSVTDGQGGTTTTTLSDAVTVRNLAPTLADVAVTPTIDENGTVTLTGRVVDAGTNDTHRVTITWGDGVTETVAVDPQTRTFTTTHRYADDAASAGVASGRYSVGVTVTDGQGGTTTTTLPDAVTVRNVAPTLADVAVTPTIDENGTVTLTGRVADAGTNDTHRVTITWGDGVTETVAVDPQTRTFTTTHRYADDAASAGVASGRYSVGVTVTDGQGGTTTTTLPDAVTVRNVAPTILSYNVSSGSFAGTARVAVSGTVSDPGQNDAVVVEIDWGDGTRSLAAVDRETGTFSASRELSVGDPNAPVDGRWIVRATAIDNTGARSATRDPEGAVYVAPVPSAPTTTTAPATQPIVETNAASSTMTVAYSGLSTETADYVWSGGMATGQSAPQTQSLPPGTASPQPPSNQGGTNPPQQGQESPPEGTGPAGAANPSGSAPPTGSDGNRSGLGTDGGGLPPDQLLTVPEERTDGPAPERPLVPTTESLLRQGGWLSLTARLPDAIRIAPQTGLAEPRAADEPASGETARANAALLGAFGMVAISAATYRRSARDTLDLQQTLALLEPGEGWSVNEELPEDWLYARDLGSVERGTD